MPDAYEHLRKYPLNLVLAALGFETFKYRKAGTEGYGACPIHGSKKNTTCFSFDDDGKFNCFSCGAKGKGAIDLKMALSKCGFQEAVDWLKGFNIQTELAKQARKPEVRLLQVPLTENPPFVSTYEKFKAESSWLKERGLLPATLERFGVFEYRNDKRKSVYNGSVMLRIARYSDSEVVGYLVRNIGEITPERPKYSMPKGLAKHLELFGSAQLKEKRPLRVLYLLESPFAVMAFHQHGFDAVSPFGWSVSEQQAVIISQLAKGVLYFPDSNKRHEAIAQALPVLGQRCWIKSPEMPSGVSDPEQLTAEQIRALS